MERNNIKKNLEKIISVITIALILLALPSQRVYALEEPEKYTPLYKQYLKLTEEQKKKVNVIPSKYGQSLKGYNKSKTPIFNNRLKSFRGPLKSTPKLPSKYNLSEHYNIKVEDQGAEGNCWTFASLETIETDTTDNLIIKVNAEPELFDKLFIDNKEVSPDNYQVTKGSTVLTIFPKYLNTLSLGTHDIKITFKDNKYVTTTLKVTEKKKEKEKDTTNNKETNIEEKNNITKSSNTTNDNVNNKNKKSKNPKTGDNILYNVLLLIISILGMIFTLIIKRKAKDSHI